MFYNSTKIVVIGSNATHKASPRIGSLGYVLEHRHVSSDNMDGTEILVFEATVLFYRYGYEKGIRLEKKKVYLVMPLLCKDEYYKNPLKPAMEYIANKKGGKGGSFLLVGPAADANLFESKESLCARLYCKLHNKNTKELMASIVSGIDHIGELYNLNKLQHMVNDEVFTFFATFLVITRKEDYDFKGVYEIIAKTFYKQPKNVDNLLAVLSMSSAIAYKMDTMGGNNQKAKMTFSVSPNYHACCKNLIQTLFKMYSFSNFYKRYRHIYEVTIFIDNLKNSITKEVRKVSKLK